MSNVPFITAAAYTRAAFNPLYKLCSKVGEQSSTINIYSENKL